jgi:uncharacterized C2H2 Zn-finger protein
MDAILDEPFVLGEQGPEAKNVCGTCGKTFKKKRNLQDHVKTQHTDQNTPEAVAKRLKRNKCRKKTRRERYASDPIYQEKEKQISRTNRMNKKARVEACAVGGTDEVEKLRGDSEANERKQGDAVEKPKDDSNSNGKRQELKDSESKPAIAPINELSVDANACSVSINASPTDVHPHPVDASEPDNRRGGGSRVKKVNNKAKTKGVSAPLCTFPPNQKEVLKFLYPNGEPPPPPPPRSKEERKANPRPSAIQCV